MLEVALSVAGLLKLSVVAGCSAVVCIREAEEVD